ncbi:TonB-dependent receptor [Danxiaibacter flavus]|uniref:TonB-dependent receptor n=1 Tax=Danxiaibacter flavus TaxID=3049108 RepID=A0ABV3Z9B9_9BACT|nr:TonB-dependent receptor [Chitinophagaceae bacterium DXS]
MIQIKKITLLGLLFLLITGLAFAQGNAGKIVGTVKSGGKSIEGATVSLLSSKDSSLVKMVVSDKDGNYVINKITSGKYLISVAALNYTTTYSKEIAVVKDGDYVTAGAIELVAAANGLANVTVATKRPAIEARPDKMVVNVDAAVTNVGSTALEVLEKSPGVVVDKDGNISLNGKSGVTVMIDGKPSYVSGADLTNLLSSMNANQLDQIELMSNPSSKFDAAGNSGIINIKTKKNKAKGFNGSVTASYGQGRYPKTNNSLNLNYRNGKFNVFMNYALNGGQGFGDLHIMRTYTGSDGKVTSIFDQPTHFKGSNLTNSLKVGMDYYLSQKTTIGFVANGFITNRTGKNNSTGYLQDASGNTDSIAQTNSRDDSHWTNGSFNLNLRHQFDSARELTADADYIRYGATNTQNFINHSYYPDGTDISMDILRGNLPSDIRIYSFKSDYTQSFKKSLKLETGIKTSYVKTDNTADYYNWYNNDWKIDYEKTNHFIYEENINAAYANLNKQWKKFSLQLGLRFENTNYKGHQLGNEQRKDSAFNRTYNNLFPTLYTSYNVDSSNQLTVSYGRRIDRPAYQDLNPFLFFINKYTYAQGNPFLLPQYTNNLELSHVWKNKITTTLSYSKTTQYFTNIFRTEGEVTILTDGNLGEMKNFGARVNWQQDVVKWWNVNINVNANYKKVNGFANGSGIVSAAWNGQLNVNNQFKFEKGWAAELSGFYNSKDIEGQFIIGPFGQVSAGVSKQVLKNKGTVKLNVRDIFYTQVIDGHIKYQNVNEHFIQSRDSRVVNISFTWRFGKPLKDAPRKKNDNGASEEQNRVKAG